MAQKQRLLIECSFAQLCGSYNAVGTRVFSVLFSVYVGAHHAHLYAPSTFPSQSFSVW